MSINRIKQLSEQHFEEVRAMRRHLHKHPELSFKEYETSRFVQQTLAKSGIAFAGGMAGTGVVATIEGKNPGKKTIALRADMDALPITEANEVPYKSQNEGVMHACGHDVHTASLLGVAKILNELKEEFEGTIRFIFQPGEERMPGGASLMIAEGVLENPKPSSIIGQHVHPLIPAGTVGFISGMAMASADEIHATVRGKGGHGAVPHDAIDPILIASHLIVALQQIVSRRANPLTPSLLTFGKLWSVGGSTNVITDEVKIEGTFRTFDEQWRMQAHGLMEKLATQLAESMGGSCEFNITKGYPFLVNDDGLTQSCRAAAEQYLGKENVLDMPMRMTSEDFAYFSQNARGCFYRLGVANARKGITSPVHTPTFDIDEDALQTSIGLMSWLAVSELAKNGPDV